MKISSFFKKHEWLVPLLLALGFILLTASGLDTMRNPDELVHRVEKALNGNWEFDQENFDYPSLPKYTMLGIGKIAYALGRGGDFKTIARFFSVLLGAGTIYLVYRLARHLGSGIGGGIIAALFVMTNHIYSLNARFAHNDLYLTFFLTLSLYFSVMYLSRTSRPNRRIWLYAAFFSVGLAASSKYNGGVFILLPLFIFLLEKRKRFFQETLRNVETLFIALLLSFFGFSLGTPKSLLWMSFYFKRMLPALSHHAAYGKTAESVPGIFGQWHVLQNMLGIFVSLFFLAAFLYFSVQILRRKTNPMLAALLGAIIIFDLPILFSYNYQARFFLPFLPFFSVLAALFWEELYRLAPTNTSRYLLSLGLGAILLFSFARVLSVRLLLQNDARNAASRFIATLPAETKLEYTMYPPEIPADHFKEEYSYPIFFTKFEGQTVPEVGFGKPYKKFNQGEEGLLKRGTDYFVVDSFTYNRCQNEAVYQTNPLECSFFADLLAGKTSYRLIGEFTYTLPAFLPQIELNFVNPEIRVYQKSE
jgi:4-amino-4-deoxy-L-arabinose transferase-like glycosyltransferase